MKNIHLTNDAPGPQEAGVEQQAERWDMLHWRLATDSLQAVHDFGEFDLGDILGSAGFDQDPENSQV